MSFTPVGYHSVARKRRRPTTSSVQESGDIDELKDQVNELRKQLEEARLELEESKKTIERQEKELEASKRLTALFKRTQKTTREHTSGSRSGGAPVYSPELTALAIACLSDGVSASNTKRVLDALACVCDLLVTPKHKVPETDWFVKKRLEMRQLNDEQLLNYVNNAQYLTLSYDETSLHSKKLGCLGLTDHAGQYTSVSFKLVLGTRGTQLASDMFQAIDDLTIVDSSEVTLATLIRKKLVALISDRSRVQECGNRKFIELLNDHPDRAGLPPIVIMICFMHTCANSERYFTRELTEDTLRLFALLRRVFGCRQTSSFNRHGLAKSLTTLQYKKNLPRKKLYESDIGARFGTFTRNGRALLNNEEITRQCLECRETGKITTLQQELIDLLNSSEWPRMQLEVGMALIIWTYVLEQFHATMSKANLTLGEAKVAMDHCFRR